MAFKPQMTPTIVETEGDNPARKDAVSANTKKDNRASGPLAASMNAGYSEQVKTLKEQNSDLSAELQVEREERLNGVLEGRIAVELKPEWIRDEVGSDRIYQTTTESWQDLLNDIRRHKQKVPIRVRVVLTDAMKDFLSGATPYTEVTPDFYLQSGRRRLAAICQINEEIELGNEGIEASLDRRELRTVRAFVSVVDDDSGRVEDLLERFKENVLRENLTGWEYYKSIGQIADSLGNMTQERMAELIDVPRDAISRGQDCLKLENDLVRFLDQDLFTMSARQVKAAIPKVKSWIEAGRPDPEGQGASPEAPKTAQTLKVDRASKKKLTLSNGYSLRIAKDGRLDILGSDNTRVADGQAEEILKLINRAISSAKLEI